MLTSASHPPAVPRLAGATTVLSRAAGRAFAQEPAKPGLPERPHPHRAPRAGGRARATPRRPSRCPGSSWWRRADIYDGRFEECRKKFGPDLQLTRDYREILAARDVTR